MFIVAAYGARLIRLVNVAHVKYQTPSERSEMNVACPPDEPVARFPHKPACAAQHGRQPIESARQSEADYLVRVVNQILRRIDNRIERYHRLTAIFEASDNRDYSRTFERLRLLEEQDREILEGLIDDLMRQFPPGAAG